MSEPATTAKDAVLLVQMADGVIREARLTRPQALKLVEFAGALSGGNLMVSQQTLTGIEWTRRDDA